MNPRPRTLAPVLVLALALTLPGRADTTTAPAPLITPPSALKPPAADMGAATAPALATPEQIQRSEKIIAALALTSADKNARLRDLVAQNYANLAAVHAARDAAIDAAKASGSGEAAIEAARDHAASRQAGLHYAFLARLSVELTPDQVEQIKDGLTYGVVPKTFRVYREMLPDLSAEEASQILAWLIEAREHAMDAGSSKEKHAWFGKYKGRINNYLSKAGYDMKQAERDMFARQKAATPSVN